MILNKRIKRELKNNIFKYGALFFMIVLSMYMVVGVSAATDSTVRTIKQFNKKNHIEDGEFSLFVPLSEKYKKNLKKKGVQTEENFYMDFDLDNNSTLRVFKNRKYINLVQLNEGELAVKDNEIVLEKHYAQKHKYKLKDTIKIAGENYIVTGIDTAPDYNLVVANASDVSSNTKKFSISFVSEKAYDILKSSGKSKSSEEYCYSYLLKGEMTDKELKTYLDNMDFDKEKITNIYMKKNLISFLANKDNPRIQGCEDDIKIDKVVSMFAGVIVIILLAYIIAIFITDNIEKESAVIGTLYSMGYLKRELLIHFLILPVFIVALGGIIGTIIGFSVIQQVAADSAAYFSFPNIKNYYPPYLIVYGIVVPTLIAIIVNVIVINKKLSKEPLKLLRKEKEQNKIANINLGNMGFINRYRIRQQFREIKGNITLFAGLFLSILLMVFAFTIHGSIVSLINNNSKDVKFNYMYLLKYPPEEKPDKTHACYTKSLSAHYDLSGTDLDVAVLGIDSDNPYYDFKVKCNKDELYISDAVAKKFGYKKGDKITLRDDLEEENYTFTVADIVKYSHGLYMFMDINNMREVFGKEDNYYNTLLSDKRINIDSSRVYSITTHKDIVDGVSLFLNNMFETIVTLLVVSIVIFILVMYLLIKMMIDKSTSSISLIKVFGFNDKEINKLYLGSSLYTVIISSIISIPLSKLIMDNIYPYMVSNVATAMPVCISPISYVMIISIIFGSYFIVNLFLRKHLKKVSLVEILKDRE